jgi:hypothetical protein
MMPTEITPFIPLILRGINKKTIPILRFPLLRTALTQVEGVNSA